MAITWTKNWSAADDGTLLKGVDLKNIQDDIDTTGVSNAETIQGFPIDAPTVTDDGKAITWDDGNQKFIYTDPSGLPVGMMTVHAGSAAPAGWALCDGSAISRTTFADLFAEIGVTYGVGDGSTTFNIPDMRGRNALGLDNMGGTSANRVTDAQADILGGTSGAETKDVSHDHGAATGSHTLVEGEIPSHTHESAVETGGGAGSAKVNADSDGAGTPINTGSTGGDGSHSHTISSDGSSTQNVMNPFMAINWIIKT
jgi:microcystin-dependent protein